MKKIIVFIFIYCFAIVFLSSGLSPIINQLYSDSGVFVHYGRVMYDGGLPYVGFLEASNKGINTYFINALGYLITPSSRTGICILEAMSKSVDLVFVFLTLNLYLSKKKSLIGTLMMFVVMMSRFTYVFGNQIEQWQFTAFIISFYLLARYNKDLRGGGNTHKSLYMFVHGICFAYAFNWKMNYVLFYVPIAIVIICYLLFRKEYKNAIKNIIAGLFGVVIGLLPIIYYLYKNELFIPAYNALFLSVKNNYGLPMSLTSVLEFIFQLKTIWLLPLFISSFYLVCKSNCIRIMKYLYFSMFVCSFIACTMSGYSFPIYHYHLYVYLIPLSVFLGNKVKFKNYYLPLLFVVTIGLNLNFVFTHIIPKEYRTTPYKVMDVLKEFSEITKENVDVYEAKIVSMEPRYYSILNTSNQNIKFNYDTTKNIGVDNIKDLIAEDQADIIFGTVEQISSLKIDDIISDRFECLKYDDYTEWTLYIKKH